MASKETEYRFLIVGKSGCGKSSTANTIIGEKLFTTGFGLDSGTKLPEYKKSSKPKKGLTFAIADTPGLFDPEVPNEEIVEHIVKASACLSPGPHAVLYVLKIDRYTPEQRQTFMRLKELFDENIVKYTIIIFTGGDELKKKKMTVDQLLEQAGEPFREVMRECGNRMAVFNNEDKGRRDAQVKELLALVQTVLMNNDNEPYHCMVQEVVNTKLKRIVTVRTQEKIERDPRLKKVFDDMATHARQARESAAKHRDEAEETLMKSQELKKMIEEREEEERREHEKREAQEKAKRDKKAQEEKEKQEQARKQQEDEHRKQKEKEQKQRDEEEKKRKSEEEKERKEREAEAKKKLEELQKKLRQLEIERETQLKLEAEKEKLRQEYEEKLEAERKKQEKEESEKTKHDVVEGKEKTWIGEVVGGAADAAGGLWRAAKGYFGF